MAPSPIAFAAFYSAIRGKGVFVLCLALCMLGLASTASAQESHIIIFDAPGADSTTGSFNGTFANSMNNEGAVTGYYIDANNVYHGFLRTRDGGFTSFEAPGADTTAGSFNGTSPNSINDLGEITGVYTDANGFNHGFLRHPNGVFATFEVPGAGGYGSFPIAVNLEGAIVGYYTDPNLLFHAFLRSPDGEFKTFVGPNTCDTGTPTGCYGNEATNINFFGTSVGNYMDENFVGHGLIRRPDGTLTTFDAPGAGTGSNQGTGCPGCSSGFNQWGAIAATYSDTNYVNHGFLRRPDGTLTTFDAPGAGTGSFEGTGCFSDCPVSLNNWGAITGIYIDANFEYHGYLRSPQGKFATVDPLGSTGTLPYSINDLGEITGYYIDTNNVYHGFLRVPD
jgi:hypothetical protein